MKTVGQVLKKRRLEKGLEIIEVAKITRIQPKFLEALESDNWEKLPSGTTARGFIKLYGQALGLAPNMMLALFRRDFMEDKTGQVIPRGVVAPLTETKGIVWTPRHTIILSIAALVTALSVYLYREYSLLVAPPSLSVDFPKENAEVKAGQVTILGRTQKDSQVWVNDEEVELSLDGSFSYSLVLPPGENTFTVEAQDTRGRQTIVTRSITVVP